MVDKFLHGFLWFLFLSISLYLLFSFGGYIFELSNPFDIFSWAKEAKVIFITLLLLLYFISLLIAFDKN